ncbi:hypothetical protein EYF80_053739 [Liparis tanakae]|uniref:TRIM8/14/16/25/29/45/65 coiled-coil region domain-containing protein n=1 Tax=Liparis tanakae TaxID=230148 RepID=A0A4Z2F4E3_9TELE|nr:hypothetical protein EYF80_053739 [Liparis tanakae]
MILERRLKIQEINQGAKLGKEAVDRELEDGVQVFTALMQSLERTQAELIGTIEATQKKAEQRPEGFVHQLDQEISELIQKSEVTLEPPSLEGTVRTAVDQLEETLGKEMKKLLLKAELNRVQMFAVDVTLDIGRSSCLMTANTAS